MTKKLARRFIAQRSLSQTSVCQGRSKRKPLWRSKKSPKKKRFILPPASTRTGRARFDMRGHGPAILGVVVAPLGGYLVAGRKNLCLKAVGKRTVWQDQDGCFKASNAFVPMQSLLAEEAEGMESAYPYPAAGDFVFPSLQRNGKVPIWPSTFVADHLRKAAIEVGVRIAPGQRWSLHKAALLPQRCRDHGSNK
jgi:hypothetical protein